MAMNLSSWAFDTGSPNFWLDIPNNPTFFVNYIRQLVI